MTLRSLERGGSGVTIGAYLAVMQVLGIEKELNELANADPLGRSLQDARLTNTAAQRETPLPREAPPTARRSAKVTSAASASTNWVSSRQLADLLSDPDTQAHTRSTKAKRR